jgi:hypothetical protein
MFIVGLPLAEVTKEQVMISTPAFTERNQIVWVKLQLRMKMKRFYMMDLQSPAFVTTGYTSRLTKKMLLLYFRPLRATFMPMPYGYACSMIPRFEYTAPAFKRSLRIPKPTPAMRVSELQENNSCEENSYHQKSHQQIVVHILTSLL